MRFVPIILLVGVFSCHSAALQNSAASQNTASQSPSSLRLATNKLSSNSVQLEIETENLVREQVRCVLNHINHESTLDIRPGNEFIWISNVTWSMDFIWLYHAHSLINLQKFRLRW